MIDFEREKEKLNEVIEKYNELIDFYELKLDYLPKNYSTDPVTLAQLTKLYTAKLKLMRQSIKKPYFARIDFKADNDKHVDTCYIGKVGITDLDNNTVTVDWRAPISSVYYDSNIGPASYVAPIGEIKGNLLVKRQYDIENSILMDIHDVDTVSNDEILKPYLGANADNRLKNIVATIQSEQNRIIRRPINENMVIQGVAGSGKTTVALHRIAYLAYNNRDNINPDQYMVIGPNKFFVNYISSVLPDLDVSNVSQLTYEEIVRSVISEDFNLINDSNDLVNQVSNLSSLTFERLKLSLLYKDAINKFLLDFEKTIIPDTDFIVKGYTILPSNIVKEFYDIAKSESKDSNIIGNNVDKACIYLVKYIKDNQASILNNIKNQYFSKLEVLSKKDIEKERKNYLFLERDINNGLNTSLKKYFSGSKPKILTLYSLFLKNISKYMNIESLNINKGLKFTISNLKSKQVEFEDLAALLYLKYRLDGLSEFKKYKHVVIDEAQDFGEFNFYTLKKIMSSSSFSIFGDLAQSIYQYRSITDWSSVIDKIFNGNCKLDYLLKSYRTTTEIMNSANSIIRHIGLNESEPVIRHGNEVSYIELNDDKISNIISKVKEFIEKGYSSIAIIAKDEEEAKYVNEQLQNNNINSTNITNSDVTYNGGICVIPSHLSKGLEFDSVIITDASENRYSSDKSIDMKLLYVSMTRALHELVIFHESELSKPLSENINQKQKKLNN